MLRFSNSNSCKISTGINMQTFDFNNEIILQDERIILRPLSINDFDFLLEYSVNEPQLWEYLMVTANGEENLKKYLSAAIKARKNKIEYPFIVYDKKCHKYVGSTRFYDIKLQLKTMQIGSTWYGKEFQGTGINKHCKYLLLDYAFGEMNMERIEFRTYNCNERSIKALKSIGCKVDGILRSNSISTDGGRRDSIVFSILRNEWYNEVKVNMLNMLKVKSDMELNHRPMFAIRHSKLILHNHKFHSQNHIMQVFKKKINLISDE